MTIGENPKISGFFKRIFGGNKIPDTSTFLKPTGIGIGIGTEKPLGYNGLELERQQPEEQTPDEFGQSKNEYNIQIEDNIIRGKNETTGKEFVIDTEKLLAQINDDEKKAAFKDMIANLPGGVLEDLSAEATFIMLSEKGGSFQDKTDRIFSTADPLVFVHELGHAIDLHYDENNRGTLLSNGNSLDAEFRVAYRNEINAYEKAGNQVYDPKNSENGNNYCTLNRSEMFAECYTLMMLGECGSKNTIKEHFPKTFAQAQELLEGARKLPDEQRHKKQVAE